MSGIKRWYLAGRYYEGMKESGEGEYVLHSDHEEEVARLRAELAAKSKDAARLDDGETQAIKQRDHAEDIIDKLCDAVLGGDRSEWSSAYYFDDAVEDVEDEIAGLRKDAERYRWLRNDAANGGRHDPAVLKDGPTDDCEFMFGSELDAAIDSAMGEGNGR